ncbi:hypothetical protein M0Q50_08995 [bacterium]|jgi:hypothetical protein|nr:hypothetical protein [bacterium]
MKKIVTESLQEYRILETEIIKGEQESGLNAEDVDSKEFLVGLEVEKIHSKDIAVQKTLVLQNLAQNPHFYSEGMKKGLFYKPSAINLYKKYFIDKEENETI